jgi:prepilin-type N-terminal cleavage/methylation domain-containing protein/prepilin-type processing-associated H-X9-DG protein
MCRRSGSRKGGFTLVELLVVIFIITVLMGVLLPSLYRVRRQARAVVCQSRLREWGMAFYLYTSDNRNRFPGWLTGSKPWYLLMQNYIDDPKLFFCPEAATLNTNQKEGEYNVYRGGTYTAWGGMLKFPDGTKQTIFSSYGTNSSFGNYVGPASDRVYFHDSLFGKKAKDVPVFMDSGRSSVLFTSTDCDPQPEPDYLGLWNPTSYACIDRHNGGINSLFGDLSVRKVGIKELWTLQWWPGFPTDNKWTRAGGVHPDDWPKWMHKYKEY